MSGQAEQEKEDEDQDFLCCCYACQPRIFVPEDQKKIDKRQACSVCLDDLEHAGGDTVCVECCKKIDQLHQGQQPKRDPQTRKTFLLCPDCKAIVHRFNIGLHYGTCVGKCIETANVMLMHESRTLASTSQ